MGPAYDSEMSSLRSALVIVGTAYHAPSPERLEVLSDVAIAVDDSGRIVAVEPAASVEGTRLVETARVVKRLGAEARLLPGLIDAHIHAPQWPQLGTGLDVPLEKWLFEYTFPLEARYADEGFAIEVWNHMVPTLLRHGTTTAVYYATVHETATFRLAEVCRDLGQRAFVGRVAMDHPDGTPEWYRDVDATESVAATARSIDAIAGLRSPLVRPIITPRFIPACTDASLRGLGDLARDTGVSVQTHCSESDWAHGYAFERFGRSDTTMLDEFGLLRRSTVLAHGNHISDSDLGVVASRGAGVAHCPMSNSYFADAVFPLRRAQSRGVHVGLGTDVAGGARPGLLSQCCDAVTVSRMLEDGVNRDLARSDRGVADSRVDVVASFHAATAGGAALLGIDVGLFEVGRQFDAMVVDVERSASGLRSWRQIDDESRLFEKIVRLAGPDCIESVWVAGRQVV